MGVNLGWAWVACRNEGRDREPGPRKKKNANLSLSQVGNQVLGLQVGQLVLRAGAHTLRAGREGVWVPVSW